MLIKGHVILSVDGYCLNHELCWQWKNPNEAYVHDLKEIRLISWDWKFYPHSAYPATFDTETKVVEITGPMISISKSLICVWCETEKHDLCVRGLLPIPVSCFCECEMAKPTRPAMRKITFKAGE